MIFERSRACFSLFRRELVSCDFYECWVKETSDSYFEGSIIESGTSRIIDLHMWFVCAGFQRSPEGLFKVMEIG